MRLNRHAVGALRGVARRSSSAAAPRSRRRATADRGARCEAAPREDRREARRLGRAARRPTSRRALLARIDAAEKAGRISPERAAKLRERVSDGEASAGATQARARARIAARGMLESGGRLPRPRPRAAAGAAAGQLARGPRREAGQERRRPRGGDGRSGEGAAREGRRGRKHHAGTRGRAAREARASSPSGSRRTTFPKK